MPGIAVKTLDSAGGKQTSSPSGDTFFVEGQPVVQLGDLVEAHGIFPHSPPPPMVEAVSSFRVNGIPVCVEGNKAACGHATTGRPHFRING